MLGLFSCSGGNRALRDLNEYFPIGRSCHLRPGHWAGTALFAIVVKELNSGYMDYSKLGTYCENGKPTAMLATLAPTYT